MAQLGIYGGNLKIAVVMVMFIQAFRFAYDPFVFSKMKEGQCPQRLPSSYELLPPLCPHHLLGVMYWIDLLKHIVRRLLYRFGRSASGYAQRNTFGVYYNLSIWYKVSDRTHYGALFSLMGVAITVAIIVIGVPK